MESLLTIWIHGRWTPLLRPSSSDPDRSRLRHDAVVRFTFSNVPVSEGSLHSSIRGDLFASSRGTRLAGSTYCVSSIVSPATDKFREYRTTIRGELASSMFPFFRLMAERQLRHEPPRKLQEKRTLLPQSSTLRGLPKRFVVRKSKRRYSTR